MPASLTPVRFEGEFANAAVDHSGTGVGPFSPQTVDIPFVPHRGKTVTLTVGPSATTSPVALPSAVANAYRVRVAASSASPVTWTLSTSTSTIPTIPTAYTTAGTGGVAGDKTIDAGGVEVIGLSVEQQTALAAGTLYLSAICPTGGSATISITTGIGG